MRITPKNSVRLRAVRTAEAEIASAPSAAIAAPIPAYTPKWWVHLVGENIMKNAVPTTTPTRRHTGPEAAPGTLPRRSSVPITMIRHSITSRTGRRRASDPSTVGIIR